MNKLPSQDVLKERFDYDPETGDLTYKIRPANRVKVGDKVKGYNNLGYSRVFINNVLFYTHRVIWCWMTGEDVGNKDIDHKNLNPGDNSWKNLRLATASENGQNNRHRGYSKRENGTWRVRVRRFGKCLFDKSVATEEEAKALIKEKRAELCGEFAPA